jgi:hypothetical protein
MNVAVDSILPCVVLGVYTVLTIHILAFMVSNSERVMSLACYIALTEPTLYLSLGDADVR